MTPANPFARLAGPLTAPRRRRRARHDGPRTIVPEVHEPAAAEPLRPGDLDAARARLKAQIPPKGPETD